MKILIHNFSVRRLHKGLKTQSNDLMNTLVLGVPTQVIVWPVYIHGTKP